MKKLLFFGSILFIAVVVVRFVAQMPASRYRGVQAQATTNNTQYPTATRTAQPTETVIPSATIDYQMTAVLAQQTAMEAVRINAQITAEFEQRILEQSQLTAGYEQRVHEIYAWTQQAALTVIPLTATQQAIINTQIPAQQAFIISQMSATANAPTQIVAMENAKNYVKFAEANQVAGVVGKCQSVFL